MVSLSDTLFGYLPVSDRDKRWGLYGTTIGSSSCKPRAPYPPTRHPSPYHFAWQQGRILSEFQVVYITRGEGLLETATCGAQTIHAGDAFVLFPGEWHRYCPAAQTGWDEHWVGFTGEYARRLLLRRLIDPRHPRFPVGWDEDLMGAFSRAIDLLKSEPPGFQQMVAAAAIEILGRIHSGRQASEPADRGVVAVVREARLQLRERLDEPIDLRALAGRLGVSYSTLRQAFKTGTGSSPHQYQLALRIGHAKRLLQATTLPVKQIAEKVGFPNASYFSRLFQRKTGWWPQDWRSHSSR